MSRTIDERVVSMQFDNAKFERNIEKTITSLEHLDETVSNFGHNGKDSFIDLQEGISKTEIMFAGFYERIGGYLAELTIGFANFAKSMTFDQIGAGFEKYTAETLAAQTITSNTTASIEETYQALGRIAKYTDETSYHYSNLVTTASKFAMSGVDLETAVTAVQGIGNWAAKSGAGIDKADISMNALVKSISSGYMNLREWITISQYAQMGSVDFVETLLQTARETSAAFREYERVNGQVNFQNFRDSVFGNNKLITSDILLKTLQKYGDETTEFGAEAKAAAKEAKTFKEAIDAVKDAVSSGWGRTFRYLFGDYAEARKFWTFIQDCMLEVFTLGQDFRNNVLERWHNLNIGGWADAFDGLKYVWEGLSNLAEPINEAFQNVFQFDETKSVKKLQTLTFNFKKAAEEFALFTGAFKNEDSYLKAVDDLANKVQSRFLDTNLQFELVDYDQIDALSEEYEIIKRSKALHENFKNTFEGLFSVIDIGKELVKGLAQGFKNLLGFTGPIAEEILKITGPIGKFVSGIAKAIKKSEVFTRVFGAIGTLLGGTLKKAIETIGKIFEKVFGKKFKLSDDFTGLEKILTKIGDAAEWLANTILNGAVSPAFDWLADKISLVIEFLKPFYQIVKNKASEAFDKLVNFFKNSGDELSPFMEKFEKAKTAIKTFWDQFKSEKLTPLADSFSTAFENVSKAIDEFKEKLKAAFKKDSDVEKDVEDNRTLFEKLLGVFEKIYDFISKYLIIAFDWISEKAQNISKYTEPLIKIFDGLKDAIGRFFDRFKKGEEEGSVTLFERVGGIIVDVFNGLLDILGKVYDYLKEKLSDITFADVLKTILGILLGYQTLQFGRLLGGLADLAKGLAGLTDIFKQANSVTKKIKEIAISILLLAIAIKTLSSIDDGTVKRCAEVIADLIVTISASMAIMNATTKRTVAGSNSVAGALGMNTQFFSPYISLAGKMTDLALAVLILAEAIKLLAKVPQEDLDKGLEVLIGIIGSVAIFGRVVGNVEMVGVGKSLLGLGVAVLAIGWSINKFLIPAAKELGTMDRNVLIRGGLAVEAFIIGFGFAAKLASSAKFLSGVGTILAIGYALQKWIVPSAQILGSMPRNELIQGGLAVVALANGLAAAVRIMSAGKVTLLSQLGGAGAFALISFALKEWIVPSVQTIGSLSTTDAIQGGAAVAALANALAAAIRIMSVGKVSVLSQLGGAGAFALISFAMHEYLIPTIKDLSGLKFEDVSEGLKILAIALGEIVVLGLGLDVVAPGLAALGLAILAIGGGIMLTAEGIKLAVEAIDQGIDSLDKIGQVFTDENSEEISKGLHNLTEVITKWLDEDWPGLCDSLWEGILTSLRSFSTRAGEIADEIFNIIIEVLKALNKKIGEIIDEVFKLLLKILEGLADAIINHEDEVVEVLKKVILALLHLVLIALKAVFDLIFGIFGTDTDEAWAWIKQAASDAWDWLNETIFKPIKDAFEDIPRWWEEDVWGPLRADLTPIWTWLNDNIFTPIGDAFKDIPRWWEEDVWGPLREDLEPIWTWLNDNIFTPIGDAFKDIPRWWEEDIWGPFKQFCIDIWNWFKEKVVDPIDGWLKEKGEQFKNSPLMKPIKDWIFPEEEVSDVAGRGEYLGDQAVSGVIKGLKKRQPDLDQAVAFVGNSVPRGLGRTLQVNSPSKVTELIGEYVVMGLVKGMEENEYSAVNAAEDMSISIAEALSSITDEEFNTDPVIKPVLDLSEIQNGSSSINDLLSTGQQYGVSFLGGIGKYAGNTTNQTTSNATTINMTINGAAGQDVNDLANIISFKLNQQLRSKERVWA